MCIFCLLIAFVATCVFIVVVNCFLYLLFVRSCMEERLCRIFEFKIKNQSINQSINNNKKQEDEYTPECIHLIPTLACHI